MYQVIYTDYRSKQVYLRDDVEGWFQFDYSPTFYLEDKNGKYLTLDGKKVSPTKKYDKENRFLYEKDVDKNLSALLEVYKEDDSVPSYHNKLYLDIETVRGGAINLPYCQSAPAKVTAVAIYDEKLKEYTVYVLDEEDLMKESKKGDVDIVPCKLESDLLMKVVDKWEQIDPTIVVGYNSDNFDIPYLYNRIRKVLGEHVANRLSPLGIVYLDEYDQKMPYKIAGVNCLDMMRLYKKFIPRQQPSYALDAICMKELGKGKIQYDGTLDSLFKNDIDKFIEYNVNDVRLLVELEAKKKFIDLAVKVSHIGHVPYHYVYQSSKLLEGVIMTYLKRKGIVSPNKPTTMNPELFVKDEDADDDEKFAGAYVKDPVPGLYGWNADLDLTSLYPSLMLQLNSSLETVLFTLVKEDKFDQSWSLAQIKLKESSDRVYIENKAGRLKELSVGELLEFIESNNIIMAPNGTGFSSDTRGFLCDVVQDWFNMRKHYKDLMKKAGKAGDKAMYSFYDLTQQIYKILLNSIYGVMGLGSFRYSDGKDMIAEAVTISGRFVIMTTGDWTNDKINLEMNTDDDYVILTDTDSEFIYLDPLLKKRFPSINLSSDEEVVPKIREIASEFQQYVNDRYAKLTLDHFNTLNNRLDIKSETIGKKIYISAKKQYAQFIVDKEGVPMQEFDMKGLDGMKSSFPKLFRDFYQALIKDILTGKDKGYIDTQILSFRNRFKNLSLEEIAKPTGINKMKEYIDKKPRAGQIFSSIRPHCPINTKAAIFYNDLLSFKKLDKRHSVIQVGDKMRWVYLKSNPHSIDVLGINVDDMCPDIIEYARKYVDKEAMFDRNLINKLEKIYDNLHWGAINLNSKVNQFMRF